MSEIAEFLENTKYEIWILPPPPSFFFKFQMAAKRKFKFGRPYPFLEHFFLSVVCLQFDVRCISECQAHLLNLLNAFIRQKHFSLEHFQKKF